MNKLLKMAAVGVFLLFAANVYSQVGVAIHIGPPHPRHEVVVVAPHVGMVWQPGYHRWDVATNAYIWVPGVWVDPPHPHAVWVAPRYRHRGDHWEFHEGHWR